MEETPKSTTDTEVTPDSTAHPAETQNPSGEPRSYTSFCKRVRRVLPEAVAESLQDDDRLANALYPTVEKSLTRSVKQDSRPLVNAIFPILGPMIRRNIAQTMRGMIQSLNRALEYTFSLHGLKWRWEAFVTGKPFAEVVMLHSLVYRVEQVFLIHKETGILLLHAASEQIDTQQKENMVSAMLTAIQDFVHDSFSTETDSQLSSIQVGDLNVWLEQSPDVLVAGVVRGDLPPSVQTQIRETAERVQGEMSEELDGFDGDVGPFERVRFDLENCLKEQFNERLRLIPLTWIILIAPVVALLWWAGLTTTENWQWRKYVRTVRSEPGLVVIEATQREGDFHIIGMRDALAADPKQLLKRHPLIALQVKSQWVPYHSLHPDFVLKRAINRLQPPESVTLKLKAGRLIVTGTAPHTWVEKLERISVGIPGIAALDTNRLKDSDADVVAAWQDCLRRLRTSPGIVVTRADAEGLAFTVEGLRDPLAANPADIVAEYDELERRVTMNWATYYAVVAGFIEKRAQSILEPPDTVTISVDAQNRLHLSGHAKRDWIERTRVIAPTIAGITAIDTSDLHDMDGNRYQEWLRYLSLLDEAPGLVVIEHSERDNLLHLIGFRDPAGTDPYAILETVGLKRGEVKAKWLPSPDATKRFVLAHAQRVLAPPDSVTLQRVEDRLIATGSAPDAWIREAGIIARCLPGIAEFDTEHLVNEDWQTMERLKYEIERVLIICGVGVKSPAQGQDEVITGVADAINKLHATALRLDAAVTVSVTGSAGPSVTGGRRRILAQQRADALSKTLVSRGIPASILAREVSLEDGASLAEMVGINRKTGVTFKVGMVAPGQDSRSTP